MGGFAIALINCARRYVRKPVAAWATATLFFLAVPMLMAHQEWDDHNRSGKTLARDMARNYLESCPPNAILITAEDNGTYPIWYLQEVEGVRRESAERVGKTACSIVGAHHKFLKQQGPEPCCFSF